MSDSSAAIKTKLPSFLCGKPVELPVNHLSLRNGDIRVSITTRISDIKDHWDEMVLAEEFDQSRYLQALEDTNPDHLNNLYLTLHSRDEKLIGVVLLQSLVLDLSSSFNYEKYATHHSKWALRWYRFQQRVVSLFKFRMLTVGNLYLTGEYGLHMDGLSADERFSLTMDIVTLLRKELCNTPYRFSGVLFKDFFKSKQPQNYKKLGLIEFRIDPNMILTIRKSWESFDDYLLDMRSKYRIRLKAAMRKFGPIQRKELTYDEVCEHNEELYALYNDILDGSGFVLARGDENYFKVLKQRLGDKLHVIGYFLNDKIVGFYTWALEGDKMDSHFIGINSSLNLRHQLYLNILLDLVKDSIQERASHLYYFRTALEIKSSVGAEPYDMTCYFKHMNPVINKLVIPWAFTYFVPEQKWKQRHPFKNQT